MKNQIRDLRREQGLSQEELARRKQAAARRYLEAGADLVIDSIRELPAAIQELNRRLADKEASL